MEIFVAGLGVVAEDTELSEVFIAGLGGMAEQEAATELNLFTPWVE